MWYLLLRNFKGSQLRIQKESSDRGIFTGSKSTWPFGISVLLPFLQGQRKGWQGGRGRPPWHPFSELPGPGPGTKVHCIQLCTCWACPHPGPLVAFLFSSLKRPQGGPRARWLDSQVASQRPCCPIERHVESPGEREEDIINHELWKNQERAGGLGEQGGLNWSRGFFFPGPVVAVVEASVLGHLPGHMLS